MFCSRKGEVTVTGGGRTQFQHKTPQTELVFTFVAYSGRYEGMQVHRGPSGLVRLPQIDFTKEAGVQDVPSRDPGSLIGTVPFPVD